ncbi:hypothetical protein B5C34_03555 [Pacificimonas flava]|uniref:Glycoside hydrolase family 127 protein n=2 Tax=Pacificimonas TaxID=1960290 RepID=A0A219B4B2_9SPHN|nr:MULTISPECIES: glycoside hydrolase family 127 protein [Pacificimonas]MBZ6377704.1 glycoside hydrolase family 127 protein [Pacificimonas aurantium]OWV32618.1 hypothetical protein B5C34_03555 [Pacificimonas flava]
MTCRTIQPTRRALLMGAAAGAVAAGVGGAKAVMASSRLPSSAQPLPLERVRLLPSPFLDAIEANRAYLLRLEPDRLLHNFRKHAGLPVSGEPYGGWESDTIAGHTLGHYLTALSLMHAQTGDAECAARVNYIVSALAEAQAAEGDGYVAGFTRRDGDLIEDGRAIFPEIMAGDIRSAGFDLNGCWVPFYNWHKLFAGLFHAQDLVGNEQALAIAVGLGGYIESVFAALTDAEVQEVLDCEHGGINESFAELHARTGDANWLALAERLRHREILDPLSERENPLYFVHANTQIPKVIGLARLHELTGKASHRTAAEYFWTTVIEGYTYVIGGNADREYFPSPNTISQHITEQTCESCNTYNMLKLSRHLFAWTPQARLFDYYERAHLNHMLAHQDPETGMFAYMVPIMSGSHREWSTPFDSFWCCVGSGMETHAKHGDSIWWQGGDTIFANLYIPSVARVDAAGAVLRMETGYPFSETIDILVDEVNANAEFTLALRIPGWCETAALSVNEKKVSAEAPDGYALIRRRWKTGDKVTLILPMALRLEPTPDDPDIVALLHGPLVLAADMGSTQAPFEGPAPALVSPAILRDVKKVPGGAATYRTTAARPEALDFAPFFQQRHRRTAVYFPRFDEAGWAASREAYTAEQAQLAALVRRSVDVMHLGEMQPERDHQLEAKYSYTHTYRGVHGRDARDDGFFSFRMEVDEGPMLLQATYWGEDRDRTFDILVDGERVATQELTGSHPGAFFTESYALPERLTAGRESVLIRFQPAEGHDRAGPVFGCRMLRADAA